MNECKVINKYLNGGAMYWTNDGVVRNLQSGCKVYLCNSHELMLSAQDLQFTFWISIDKIDIFL